MNLFHSQFNHDQNRLNHPDPRRDHCRNKHSHFCPGHSHPALGTATLPHTSYHQSRIHNLCPRSIQNQKKEHQPLTGQNDHWSKHIPKPRSNRHKKRQPPASQSAPTLGPLSLFQVIAALESANLLWPHGNMCEHCFSRHNLH